MVSGRYHCPRCGRVVTLERDASLADKSVTAAPLAGWTYARVGGDYDDADWVRIRCGEAETDREGCQSDYYLNFLRFENGREVGVRPDSAVVELARAGPSAPSGPDQRPD